MRINRDFQGVLTLKSGKYGVYISIRPHPPRHPGAVPRLKKVTRSRTETKENLSQKNTGKKQSALAELAAAAVVGRPPMAEKTKPKTKIPSTTENQMLKSIFDLCSVDGINNLRNGAIEGIKNIVAEESEGDLYQYFLPKKIWSELDKSISHVSDLMSGKEQAQATKRREKSVSIAIADATQHILKFLYPGQILILSMLDEIRIENKLLGTIEPKN